MIIAKQKYGDNNYNVVCKCELIKGCFLENVLFFNANKKELEEIKIITNNIKEKRIYFEELDTAMSEFDSEYAIDDFYSIESIKQMINDFEYMIIDNTKICKSKFIWDIEEYFLHWNGTNYEYYLIEDKYEEVSYIGSSRKHYKVSENCVVTDVGYYHVYKSEEKNDVYYILYDACQENKLIEVSSLIPYTEEEINKLFF